MQTDNRTKYFVKDFFIKAWLNIYDARNNLNYVIIDLSKFIYDLNQKEYYISVLGFKSKQIQNFPNGTFNYQNYYLVADAECQDGCQYLNEANISTNTYTNNMVPVNQNIVAVCRPYASQGAIATTENIDFKEDYLQDFKITSLNIKFKFMTDNNVPVPSNQLQYINVLNQNPQYFDIILGLYYYI